MVKTKVWPLVTSLLALNTNNNQAPPSIDKPISLDSISPNDAIIIAKKEEHLHVKVASSLAKSERRHVARLSSTNARPICSGCKRPTSICLCHCLPKHKIETKTKILILQHPSEFRRKTVSTVPLIPLVLEHCKVCVGYKFHQKELERIDFFQEAIISGEKPLLLFPGPDAFDLSNLFPILYYNDNDNDDDDDGDDTGKITETSETKPSLSKSNLLILLDGTWSQAKRMAKESPDLIRRCQKVQFTGPGNSIYDAIRKEPELHFVSTLECCVQALSHLEPSSNDNHTTETDSTTTTTSSSSTSEASIYLMNALKGLVHQQLEVRNSPDRIRPRYIDPKKKYVEKHETRRLEIEQNLFHTQTPGYYYDDDDDDEKKNHNKKGGGIDVTRLKDGSTLRPLHHSDTLLIHQSFFIEINKSLTEIRRCIDTYPACFGIFRGHKLCGYILQDKDEVLGIPIVEEKKYRRKGYGSILLQKASELLFEKEGQERISCFIEDGNKGLEKLFSNQGWTQTNNISQDGTVLRTKWIKE